jgi:ribosomal protein S18 acetylase RimI-like enzyme
MIDHLVIRPYRPADEEAVVRLWIACNLVIPLNNPRRDIERKLAVDPARFLVGEFDGEVVATCMAGYEGHRGWINYLAVLPRYQRRGIASRMMEEAERILRAAGCPKINLQVRAANREVIRFYESIGYVADDIVNMGKRLEYDEPFDASRGDVAHGSGREE